MTIKFNPLFREKMLSSRPLSITNSWSVKMASIVLFLLDIQRIRCFEQCRSIVFLLKLIISNINNEDKIHLANVALGRESP